MHPNSVTVTLHCRAPDADTVCVAGTFNDWDPAAAKMVRGKNDIWRLRVNLPAGNYEYKYVVNGNWCCDPGCTREQACPNCIPNSMGTMNRILIVTADT